MSALTVLAGNTALYTVPLLTETGAAFGAFLTLTLTLTEAVTGGIINSRNAQNVNGTNGVTMTNGVLQWVVSAADNVIVIPTLRPYERHVAVFVGTWNPGDGVRQWRHVVEIYVRNA